MIIRVLESPRELASAAERWDELWARSPSSDVFTTHDWIAAWWEAFAAPADALSVFCVERAGRFVAAIPLMRSPKSGVRRLCSIFNHYSGRSGVLLDPAEPGALFELFSGIYAARDSWDVVELEWYPEDSPAFSFLAGGGVPGLSVYAVRTNESPYLPLLGAGFEAWYGASFSAKTRSRDRASLREAAARAGFKLEVLRGLKDGELRGLVDTVMHIETLGWKGEQGSAMRNDERASRFLHSAAERLSRRGGLSVTLLEVEQRPIAFVLGLVDRGGFYYFKTSFDPAYEDLRPGRIVTTRSIEAAFADGLERFDFLGAADEYKLRYTSLTRPHAAVFLYHQGFRSKVHRLMKRSAIPMAKVLLGRGTLYPVRVDH